MDNIWLVLNWTDIQLVYIEQCAVWTVFGWYWIVQVFCWFILSSVLYGQYLVGTELNMSTVGLYEQCAVWTVFGWYWIEQVYFWFILNSVLYGQYLVGTELNSSTFGLYWAVCCMDSFCLALNRIGILLVCIAQCAVWTVFGWYWIEEFYCWFILNSVTAWFINCSELLSLYLGLKFVYQVTDIKWLG
jgi:hypothetical protein